MVKVQGGSAQLSLHTCRRSYEGGPCGTLDVGLIAAQSKLIAFAVLAITAIG